MRYINLRLTYLLTYLLTYYLLTYLYVVYVLLVPHVMHQPHQTRGQQHAVER